MLIYKSPITKINNQSFEDLSLKLTEIISLLEFLTEYGDMPNKEACTVSALERLANWMQADIEALQAAYKQQHGEQVDRRQQLKQEIAEISEIPEEVIQAFERVNAAYRASQQTEGEQP